MITMKEIAERAGLSRYTVSKILNGDTTVKKTNRQKVLELCEHYGFVPNSNAVSLVSGYSNVIGMVVPYITDGFYAELIELTEKYAAEHGMGLIYRSSYNDAAVEAGIIRSFTGLKIAALLAVPAVQNPDLRAHRLAAANFPVIYIDRAIPGAVNSVMNDNFAGGKNMTDHLFEHSNEVAFLDSFYGNANLTASERRRGYLTSVAEHGAKAIFIPNQHSREQQDNERFGYENFYAYLKEKHTLPRALFCVTDAVAQGAAKAIHEAGFTVGKDIFIGGHDNLRFSEYANPPLTSMAQPKQMMAHAAVDMAIARIKNPELEPEQHSFSPELIIRKSSGIQ